jgi:hypothetical protein
MVVGELVPRMRTNAGSVESLDIGPTSAEVVEPVEIAEKEEDTGDAAAQEIGEEAAPHIAVAAVVVAEAAAVGHLTRAAQMN